MTAPTQAALIRPVTLNDAPAIFELVRQLGYEVDPGRHLPLLEELLGSSNHSTLLAEVDGHVTGFINTNFRPMLRYGGIVATVDELCVDASHRGHRIGAKLLQAVIVHCRERGAHHLELTTNKRRVDALRFYERQGFEITSHKLVHGLAENER